MKEIREGQLLFSFPDNISVTKMDEAGTPMPETMRKVDLLIEEQDRSILVEIKDPSDFGTTQTGRDQFIHNLKSRELVNTNLVPKCRDTYTYLHLMQMVDNPLIYIVLICIYEHAEKPEFFLGLYEQVKRRLEKEGKYRWEKQYVSDCVVVNMAEWNRRFPTYPVSRNIV